MICLDLAGQVRHFLGLLHVGVQQDAAARLGRPAGLVLGLLLGGVAYLWKGNPWLGFVVGGALAANTLVSVCLGGLLPLGLKKIKLDPALVSGPLLTTVTDMCGFFFVLSFATVILPRLGG